MGNPPVLFLTVCLVLAIFEIVQILKITTEMKMCNLPSLLLGTKRKQLLLDHVSDLLSTAAFFSCQEPLRADHTF